MAENLSIVYHLYRKKGNVFYIEFSFLKEILELILNNRKPLWVMSGHIYKEECL